MESQLLPDWVKTGLDQRFMELAHRFGIRHVQPQEAKKFDHMLERLKSTLPFEHYQLVLDLDELQSYRNAVEKEWMYQAGVKDGLKMAKQMQDLMSN